MVPQAPESLRCTFDLWSAEHVSRHTDAILERLQDATVPCDGARQPERVAVFGRWVDAGKSAAVA